MIRAVSNLHRIGLRVRALRLERGLSQEALAGEIDRSVDTISSLERGIGSTSLETLERLAACFEVRFRDLLDGEDEPAPEQSARTGMQVALAKLGRSLSDDDLGIAVELVRVLAKRRHVGADAAAAARRSGPREK
jgi:transcriptional regulator with XRE-family HTH domain